VTLQEREGSISPFKTRNKKLLFIILGFAELTNWANFRSFKISFADPKRANFALMNRKADYGRKRTGRF
jgi:hypothetical protein